jgi:hypothetical protein
MPETSNKSLSKKLKRGFLVSAFLVGLLALSTLYVTENTYVTYPRVPNPSLGRVVPYDVKGITVYVTESQRETVLWATRILDVSIALVLLGLVLNKYYLPKSDR